MVLVLAPFFWGGNSVAGKLASLDWEPFTATSLRWLMASLLLLPFALKFIRNDYSALKGSALTLFALGASMSMFSLLMYFALNYTSAINVSIEQAAMPAMIMLANFMVFSQRVTVLQISGLLCCVLGVLITTTNGAPHLFFEQGLNRGDAIMMLACVFYAAYTFGLRWRPPIHWLSFLWAICTSAFIVTIPFALWESQHSVNQLSLATLTDPGLRGWTVMVYIILFPTIVGQLCYARGVDLIGGNRAGIFINLVPIFGSLLAVLILREKFQIYHAIGLIMVVGGISFAERHTRRH